MIQLVCPACSKYSDRVITKLVILAQGYMRVVPGRESGVERAIASPVRSNARKPKTNIETEGDFICVYCGESNSINKWKYMVICDNCGRDISSRPVGNPSKIVDDNICRDTMSLLCDDCWVKHNRDYCERCRFNETCIAYNNR